ncbi:MAG: hypothetical protein QW279_10760 [Candidatus Jordarchaeaceae archaeon]
MKLFLRSTAISMLLTVMMISTVQFCFAATKSAYNWDPKVPYLGEQVSSYVQGDYNAGGVFYWVRFISTRGLGTADGYDGYLWFWWTIDGNTIEWYTSGNQQDESGYADCNYLKCRSRSGFYKIIGGSPYTWYRDTTAGPITT